MLVFFYKIFITFIHYQKEVSSFLGGKLIKLWYDRKMSKLQTSKLSFFKKQKINIFFPEIEKLTLALIFMLKFFEFFFHAEIRFLTIFNVSPSISRILQILLNPMYHISDGYKSIH